MPKSFERCIQHVKGKVRSPYGVCTNAYKKTHGGKAPKLHHGHRGSKRGR